MNQLWLKSVCPHCCSANWIAEPDGGSEAIEPDACECRQCNKTFWLIEDKLIEDFYGCDISEKDRLLAEEATVAPGLPTPG